MNADNGINGNAVLGIYGAGLMGMGIAQFAFAAGHKATGFYWSSKALSAGKFSVHRKLVKSIRKEKADRAMLCAVDDPLGPLNWTKI